ncbi:MAG: DUF1484 family protein [Cupriavidus sp.]|nr:DUF1484 family protein [Cupriavidus sp.]
MREHQQREHHLALCQQRRLIAQFVTQLRPANARARTQLNAAMDQITALGDCIRDTTENSCYALLRVSAGLDGILCLLDLQSDKSPAHHSLHCLLSPLKEQLDEALSHIHDML